MVSSAKFSSTKNKRLSVTNAFHSALVEKLVAGLGQVGKGLTFHKPVIPMERATQESNELLDWTKTYTFFLDNNPIFYVISHIVGLACNDKAFRFLEITPRMVLTLGVRPRLNCPPIQWRDEILDVPIFRLLSSSKQGEDEKPDEPLPYSLYHGWVRRLGEETGFMQVLNTYCLRRAAGNAINDDPNSNEAVRNLVLDHASSIIFQRNYLSRIIRYDTQAAYRGTASRGDLIVTSHRMSRTIDPRRPRGPSLQQLQHLRQDAGIQALRERQQDLYDQIRAKFKFIYRADGQPIYNEYQ
ncbi:MAG: hypothetical protein Q9175_006943 [Cornicularia normoerica]